MTACLTSDARRAPGCDRRPWGFPEQRSAVIASSPRAHPCGVPNCSLFKERKAPICHTMASGVLDRPDDNHPGRPRRTGCVDFTLLYISLNHSIAQTTAPGPAIATAGASSGRVVDGRRARAASWGPHWTRRFVRAARSRRADSSETETTATTMLCARIGRSRRQAVRIDDPVVRTSSTRTTVDPFTPQPPRRLRIRRPQ